MQIGRLSVAEQVPADEAESLKKKFTRVQSAMSRLIPPSQPGLPEIADDPSRALASAFTQRHNALFRAPQRTPADLGALAVASPYASYLEAVGDGSFRWDVSMLSGFEHHAGLVPLGATVTFERVGGSGRLEPRRIETVTGATTPDDAGWVDAQRLALCSITTHASMVRHFNWLHLTSGAPLEAITRNHLRGTHCVRRLVWPHVFGTHASNDLVTQVQMGPGGDFETIFSFTHRGMCELFEATTCDFDLALVNPATDVERLG